MVELIQSPAIQGDEEGKNQTIFDYICDLQDQINGEAEMVYTFAENFQSMIDNTIKQQIETYYDTQLTFQSDLEIFKYTAIVEANNSASRELPKP